MFVQHESESSNELHLLGGLRAGTHEDGYLVIFPTTDCKVPTGLRRSIFSFALPAA
jgi:hypothetical protein